MQTVFRYKKRYLVSFFLLFGSLFVGLTLLLLKTNFQNTLVIAIFVGMLAAVLFSLIQITYKIEFDIDRIIFHRVFSKKIVVAQQIHSLEIKTINSYRGVPRKNLFITLEKEIFTVPNWSFFDNSDILQTVIEKITNKNIKK